MHENQEGIYLGFDPGGDRKFGVAFVNRNVMKSSTVSSVDDAMRWVADACGVGKPVAAGIDTLLHWATSASGMRPCDRQLRARYPAVQNSIMAPNSLFGAMAIGGMALALRLRQEWPELVLNETHPKVLLHELGKSYDPKNLETIETATRWFVNQAGYAESNIVTEHELDAALSAWSTRKGITERWADIVGNRDKLIFPAGDVRYLWPKALN